VQPQNFISNSKYEGGTFAAHNFGTTKAPLYPYKNWDSAVCNTDPYEYLKPFEFRSALQTLCLFPGPVF
jgi:hypothetical protein